MLKHPVLVVSVNYSARCDFGSTFAHALQVDFCAARDILRLYVTVYFVHAQQPHHSSCSAQPERLQCV